MNIEGIKHDGEKDRWELLPSDAVRAIVKVLTLGAAKYGARNWENGIKYSRLYAATLRHLTAWFEGEDLDPESGLPHLAHAGCELLFLLAFVTRGRRGLDDRPRITEQAIAGACVAVGHPAVVMAKEAMDRESRRVAWKDFFDGLKNPKVAE